MHDDDLSEREREEIEAEANSPLWDWQQLLDQLAAMHSEHNYVEDLVLEAVASMLSFEVGSTHVENVPPEVCKLVAVHMTVPLSILYRRLRAQLFTMSCLAGGHLQFRSVNGELQLTLAPRLWHPTDELEARASRLLLASLREIAKEPDVDVWAGTGIRLVLPDPEPEETKNAKG